MVRDQEAPPVVFEDVAWTDATAAHLARIDGLDEALIDNCRQLVATGELRILGAFVEGVHVGSALWATYDEDQGRVFVVEEMGAAPVRGVDLTEAIFAAAMQLGPFYGCAALRFVTRRAGLVKKLKDRFELVQKTELGDVMEMRL